VAESKSKSKGSSRSRGSSKSSSSSSSRRSSGSGSSRSSGSSSRRSSRGDRSPRDVAREAVRQLQELTGRPVEAVTGMERNGREWTLTVEVVELERIPNTTDVLGRYEVTVGKDGELTAAKRTRRYTRGQPGED
jgi:Gas vesicle synthesis protein GvpO